MSKGIRYTEEFKRDAVSQVAELSFSITMTFLQRLTGRHF